MRAVILGANGQVGRALQTTLAEHFEVLALTRQTDATYCGDLTRPQALAQSLRELRPDVIFNAAAFTAVDLAQTQTDLAMAINAQSLTTIGAVAKELQALVVHFSTDYVFNGAGSHPHRETDPVSPLNVYGQTKALGEAFLEASGADFLLLRTSWVVSATGKNFIKTILHLARIKTELSVVADQIGAPTTADFIAEVARHLSLRILKGERHLLGTYHVVPKGETSWYDFAVHIVRIATDHGATLALESKNIRPISSSEYPTPARRPLNSRLDNRKLQSALGSTVIHSWSHYCDPLIAVLAGDTSSNA